ncbi:MAG: 4-oxalocrotonate decarboxylase [Flavobacteriales bacterium]|nr:4-oxalocrotonate decarboxylase [Flavobacteriales bacterium]
MNIKHLAKKVDNAAANASPIAQLTKANDFSIDDAYAIQRASIERRLSRGEEFIGVKMGFTSKAKMEQMGVHDLIFGVLTSEMSIDNGGQVAFSKFIHPRAEPEIAFRISETIDSELSLQSLSGHVDGIAPAIEIIDSRYENFKFNLEDVLADNCSSSGLVIGDWSRPEIDVDDLKMELVINGQVRQLGNSRAILEDPWAALQHATRLASKYGWTIPKGSIVLAGAATPAEFLAKGDEVKVIVESLGEASFSVT